jgi:carboxymethylenebutenolidase
MVDNPLVWGLGTIHPWHDAATASGEPGMTLRQQPRLYRRKPFLLFPASLLLVYLALPNCIWGDLLTPAGVKPEVYGTLYQPTTATPRPAVVILPGRRGIRPGHPAFAQALVAQGYVALVLDYFATPDTPTPRRMGPMPDQWPTWQQRVQGGIRYLQQRPGVQAERIGVVGFSLGAFLAVWTAGVTPVIKAVVCYYGGVTPFSRQYVPHLPPVLILHGGADSTVPLVLARNLYDALIKHGKTVVMHVYPNAEHAFNYPDSPWYDPEVAADAWRRTLAFLTQYLR